jgi:3-oxoacyl-[acyl-carrier-protein] synthase II
VTGVDCLTSLGSTADTWAGILDNRHAYQPMPDYIRQAGKFRAGQVAFIPDYEPAPEIAEIRADRFVHLAATCATRAMENAGLELEPSEAERFGVILGSGTGAAGSTEQQFGQFFLGGYRKINPFFIPLLSYNSLSGHLAIHFNAQGPNLTVSTACSSGNQAISLAYDAIAMNRADVMLAGASDSPGSAAGFAGFDFLRVMAPGEAGCHPFSRDRNGFVIGEGAGLLVLEELDHALARNARIYGEIAGFSMSCDAHHIVMPYPEGIHVEASMRKALVAAHLSVHDVDYINAHGTATSVGDRTESSGIERCFGETAARIPVSSIKGAVGHTLGASAAIEAVVCMLALRDQIVPPTVNFSEPDPELPLDFVAGEARECELKVILSNSFGFGGNNSTIVFKQFTA